MFNSNSLQLYPRERPDTHCTRGWVDPKAGLNGFGTSRHPPGFDPRTFQSVARRHTDRAIRSHRKEGVKILFEILESQGCLEDLAVEVFMV
jgi:hypothetical protein